MNKLEQVSSLGHQMSLAGGMEPGPRFGGGVGSLHGGGLGWGVPVGEGQCNMGNGHMGPPSIRMTDMSYLPTTSLEGGKYSPRIGENNEMKNFRCITMLAFKSSDLV